MRIVVVDYGMGNIRSIESTLSYLGVNEVIISSDHEELSKADKIILPGVGSFGKAMNQIRKGKLDVVLKDLVAQQHKPMLGICLGMQLMGMSSTEDGVNEGLGLINAVVTKFEEHGLKIPHVGFNQVMVNPKVRLYEGLPANPDFYFTHSYKMTSEHDIMQSNCKYGSPFIASFEKKNIAGVQFHPELSQYNGLKLLRNFIDKF